LAAGVVAAAAGLAFLVWLFLVCFLALFTGVEAGAAAVSAKTKLEVADKNNAAKAIANNFFMVFLLKILGGSKLSMSYLALLDGRGE
jgi:hypothetical protein